MTQVTALIRTHNRPEYFKRCMESVLNQIHPRTTPPILHLFKVLVSVDDPNDGYVNEYDAYPISFVRVRHDATNPFFYNLYCNDLKSRITNGWFFFLDDDDFLVDNTAIERIIPYLTDPTKVVICQMLRGQYAKPEDRYMDRQRITRGHIGMPCIFVHSSLKDSVNFTDNEVAHLDIKMKSYHVGLKREGVFGLFTTVSKNAVRKTT